MPRPELSPELTARLSALTLKTGPASGGAAAGRHRSRTRGESLEFYEHRQYSPLDDTRRIDWKLFARKEKLYLKSYTEESRIGVNVMLDISASMACGGNGTKFKTAVNLAAAMLYFACLQNDSFSLSMLGDGLISFSRTGAGPEFLMHLFSALGDARPSGKTDIVRAVGDLASKRPKKGLFVLITDIAGTTAAELGSAARVARAAFGDSAVFWITSGEEEELPPPGRLKLQDAETGELFDIDSGELRFDYMRLFAEKVRDAGAALAGSGTDLVRFRSDSSFEPALLAYLSGRRPAGA